MQFQSFFVVLLYLYVLPYCLTDNSALNISAPFCFQVHPLSSVTDSLIISIFLKPGKELT